MSNQLLHKFLNNEITPEEMEQLKSSEVYRDYLKIASLTSSMHTPVFNREVVWKKLSEKRTYKKPQVLPLFDYRSVLKYAALLVLVVTAYLYVTNLDITLTAGLAEKKSFTLPDNSEVVLNAGSRVSYDKKSWNDKRTLALDGEAFFKVAKGKKFDVQTPQGTVSVLGTQFNVQSRKNHFHVSCYEGLVNVSFNGQNIQLPAGNSVIIENQKLIAKQSTKVSKPGWMFDESGFDNAALITVIEELERQYDIKVSLDNIDKNIRFSGAFTHTDLEAALKTICLPLQLNYTIEQQKRVLIYDN